MMGSLKTSPAPLSAVVIMFYDTRRNSGVKLSEKGNLQITRPHQPFRRISVRVYLCLHVTRPKADRNPVGIILH